MGTDAKANTSGGGALELGDSRLFEDGSERGGALDSDVIDADTVRVRGAARVVRKQLCVKGR